MTIKQLSSSSSQKVRSARVSAPDGFAIDERHGQEGQHHPQQRRHDPRVGDREQHPVAEQRPDHDAQRQGVHPLRVEAVPTPGGRGGKNGTDYATGGSALSRASDSQLDTDRHQVQPCVRHTAQGWPRTAPSSPARPPTPPGSAIKVAAARTPMAIRVPSPMSRSTLAIVRPAHPVSRRADSPKSRPTATASRRSSRRTIRRVRRSARASATTSSPRAPLGSSGAARPNPFDIEDVAKVVQWLRARVTPTRRAARRRSLDVNSSGILTVSLGLDGLTCNNSANQFYEHTSEAVTWDVTQANSRTVITIRLDASTVDRPVQPL